MSLKIKSRKLDSVVVIDMIGRLTGGEPQMLFRNTIRHFVDDGSNKFVLNLTDVSYIDSSGLGELAITQRTLTDNGGQVNLLGLANRVSDLMVMTKLALVFDFFDEESKAIAALLQAPRTVAREAVR